MACRNDVIIGNHNRRLTAIDAKTGDLLWVEKRDMFPILIDGYLVCLADREGKLVTARPKSAKFQLISEQEIYDVKENTRVESPMAFANETLFIRTDFALIALRLTN